MLKYNLSMYLADQSKIRDSNIRAYGWVIPQLTVAFAVIVARSIMHQRIYALAAVGVQSEFARTCVSAPLIVGLSLRYAQLFFTATDHSNHYTIASISLNMPRAIPRMFSRAPDCCGAQMSRRQTSSNYNGNRDRWRYFCRNCPRMVFDDWEGIRDGNPLCDCSEFSREQIEHGRVFVFRCARKDCEFMEEETQ
ncbi:hypothetical protein CBS147355_8700 [Penicillium roqueforti]|nr:hypothetical protein CBS147355_8700 [Penicillium roqueforti]